MFGKAPAVSAAPPTVDAQDPLPESNWLWRRVFVFLIVAATYGWLGYALWSLNKIGTDALQGVGVPPTRAAEVALAAVESLYRIGTWLCCLAALATLLYLVAPSAEQAGKWFASLSAWKSGISTSTASRVSGPQGTAATSTTTGPATGEGTPAALSPATPAAPLTPPGVGAAGTGTAPPVVDLSQE